MSSIVCCNDGADVLGGVIPRNRCDGNTSVDSIAAMDRGGRPSPHRNNITEKSLENMDSC